MTTPEEIADKTTQLIMRLVSTVSPLVIHVGHDFQPQLDTRVSIMHNYLFTEAGLDVNELRTRCPASTNCGRIFSRGELLYHCTTCAVDETCVLCCECFQEADHVGHKYKYYQSQGEGGSCDCGEFESWKATLSCPKHLSQKDALGSQLILSPQEMASLKERLFNLVRVLRSLLSMKYVLGKFNCDSIRELEPGESLIAILENDEVHSFQDIIGMLADELYMNEEKGGAVAQIVDERGFAPIAMVSLEDPNELNIISNLVRVLATQYQVSAHVKTNSAVTFQLLAHAILLELEHLARTVPCLREIILWCIVEEQTYPPGSLASFIVEHDINLWKEFRQKFQSLMTLGVPFEFVKLQVLQCYENLLDPLIRFYEIDDRRRTSALSFLHFSVQVFTVPSIAREACRRQFHHKLCRVLQDCIKKLNVEKDSIEPFLLCLNMLKYIATDISVKQQRLIVSDTKFLNLLLGVWQAVQKKFIKRKRTTDHVEYDNPHVINEGNLGVGIISFLNDFVECFENPVDICMAIEAEQKKLVVLWQKLTPNHKDGFSFLQPNLWYLGMLLQRFHRIKGDIKLLPRLNSTIAEIALKCVDNLSSVKAGEWVRNGIEVAFLSGFVNSGPIHGSIQYFYFILHWYILGGGRELSIHFTDTDYLERPAYVSTFIKALIQVFLGSADYNLKNQDFIKIAVCHALATGPMSFSQIESSVPSYVADHSSFEQAVDQCSTISGSVSLTASQQYTLKGYYANCYNPFYWYYRDAERETAHSYMKQRFSRTKYKFISESEFMGAFGNVQVSDLKPSITTLLDAITNCYDQGLGMMIMEDAVCFLAATLMLSNEIFVEWQERNPVMLSTIRSFIESNEETSCLRHIFSTNGTFLPVVVDQAGLKQRSALKKQQALQSILEAQAKFSQVFETAKTMVVGDGINTSIGQGVCAEFEPVETGCCVVCQEEGTEDNPLGLLGSIATIPFTECNQGSTMISCFHIMHLFCFTEVHAHQDFKCPLCRKPVTKLFPICYLPILPEKTEPLNIQDLLEDIQEIGTLQPSTLDGLPQVPPIASRMLYQELKDNSSSDIMDWIVQNCRQALVLQGCPEYSTIIRIARLLKSFVLQKSFQTRLQPLYEESSLVKSVSEVILHMIRYSPLDRRLKVHQNIIRSIREEATKLKDFRLSLELTELCKYWASVWFEELAYEKVEAARILSGRADLDECQKLLGIQNVTSDSELRKTITLKELAKLPSEFSEFFKLPSYCSQCRMRKEYTTWFICLYCGGNYCPMESCSKNFRSHEKSCRKNPIMFLVPSRCSIVLIDENRATRKIPAPYLDRHGQTDFGFRNGGPLFLSIYKYDILRRLWASGGITGFISEKPDRSSLQTFAEGLLFQ